MLGILRIDVVAEAGAALLGSGDACITTNKNVRSMTAK
jgi:hypothetical protein